jgi:hypothetical protein
MANRPQDGLKNRGTSIRRDVLGVTRMRNSPASTADGPSRPSAVLAVVGCGYHRRCARGQCRSGWYSAHYLGACATAPMKKKPRPGDWLGPQVHFGGREHQVS